MRGTGVTGDIASDHLPAVSPELPVHYVDRPRLLSPLRAVGRVDRGILAVWGTAGSGKSTLLASWARHLVGSGNSVEWLLGEVERYERPIALVLLALTVVWVAYHQWLRWRGAASAGAAPTLGRPT